VAKAFCGLRFAGSRSSVVVSEAYDVVELWRRDFKHVTVFQCLYCVYVSGLIAPHLSRADCAFGEVVDRRSFDEQQSS
jgi:hypothetical protein